MNSWLNYNKESDFSIHNLPFGIFSNGAEKRVGVAIGNQVIDLVQVYSKSLLKGVTKESLTNDYLNDFIALGKPVTNQVRLDIQSMLCDDQYKAQLVSCMIDQSKVTMHMPVKVGDYTDFYSSIEHATNVGMMFRDPENALLPNWRHIPVGYHGRASSIVVSGTDIHRPKGQKLAKGETSPSYGPCRLLDFELEMAFIVGKETSLGDSISTDNALDHIFGMVIFNDWSARDIQKWEYVPLGPFLGKNFASSVSPWVVTMEALAPFRQAGPKQNPEVLPYLKYSEPSNYDIALEVQLQPDGDVPQTICSSNYKYMYWNMRQQLAHHTVNGCNVNVGDMLASGTISGKSEDSYGSMLELSWAGSKTIDLANGVQRKFVADGDTIIMKAAAKKDGKRVGFGSVSSKVLPAK